MSSETKTDAERARDLILRTVLLAQKAPTIHAMGRSELEAYATRVAGASSDLNGAAQRLRRMAKHMKKAAAAVALYEKK